MGTPFRWKEGIMFKYLMVIAFLILTVTIIGCNITTPEIRGVVLDEETKQPVSEAWVSATLHIETKTIQGIVHKYLSVEQPHTRTDKDGRFVIPSRRFKKPPFPISFGTRVESLSVNASTIDDKSGGFFLTGYEGKKGVDITIYVKPWEKGLSDEREYFSYIQALYNYCLTGRFGVEIPAVEGGCDEWELNFVIVKHERYLNKYKIIAEGGKARGYFATLDQLSELYEKKGDFKKAIEPLKEKLRLMEIRGLLRFQDWQRDKKDIEKRISDLQKKLEGVKR